MSDWIFWVIVGLVAYFASIAFILVVIDLSKKRKRVRYLWPDGTTSLHRPPRFKHEIDWDFPEDVGRDERE